MRGAGELHRRAIYGLIGIEGLYCQFLRKSGLLLFEMSLLERLELLCSVSGIC